MFDEDAQTNQSAVNHDDPGAQDDHTQVIGGGSVPPATGAPAHDDTTVAPTAHDDLSSAPSGQDSELSRIKGQALDQLSPLVHKLDQTPEDKYKTIMMLIQASDNQSLIPEAYDAAQKITDEKIKAEALLNIVNEINYFTQKS